MSCDRNKTKLRLKRKDNKAISGTLFDVEATNHYRCSSFYYKDFFRCYSFIPPIVSKLLGNQPLIFDWSWTMVSMGVSTWNIWMENS